jgi:hypothetical protein
LICGCWGMQQHAKRAGQWAVSGASDSFSCAVVAVGKRLNRRVANDNMRAATRSTQGRALPLGCTPLHVEDSADTGRHRVDKLLEEASLAHLVPGALCNVVEGVHALQTTKRVVLPPSSPCAGFPGASTVDCVGWAFHCWGSGHPVLNAGWRVKYGGA